MPRPTLPKCVERLTTMNVMITQHTESDLWSHMCRMNTLLEEKGDWFWEEWDNFVNDMFRSNRYAKYTVNDWRFHRVKRVKAEDWREDWNDETSDEYMILMSITHDLERCNKAFDWRNTKEGFGDMESEAYKFNQHFKYDEFSMYESMKFRDAERKYKTDDAEYIKERSEFRHHEDGHISGDLPTQKISAQSYETDAKYRSHIDEAKKTCKYCIALAQAKKEREEAEELYLMKTKEEDERWQKEQAEKRKELEIQMRRPSRMHSCDDCDYHTTSMGSYSDHMESREHKAVENRKKWYCKDCGIQSRSTQEHEFHVRSKKHLKAVGELEEEEKETQVFECKACKYSTPYKQVYQTHMKSAKHLKNTA